MPRGLAVLRSPSYAPLRKTDMMGTVCMRHCRLLFMKQVLPRFCRPTRPGRPSERCARSSNNGASSNTRGKAVSAAVERGSAESGSYVL
jgi:hypothetical protein